MAEAGRRVRELSPEQRAILLRRLMADRETPPSITSLGDAAPPLSFAQERQWFLDQMSPGDPAHVIAGALRLEGALCEAALQRAFDDLVRRHAPLRARFTNGSGHPLQSIMPPAPLAIDRVDLGDLPEDAREGAARSLYAAASARGFDLAADSPLRVTLIRIAEEEHLLVFALHHIAGDGWSIGVLLEELARGYAAHLDLGEPPPPLPIGYGDFAAWQRRRLEQGGLARSLDYWRGQLAEAPPVLELPADRPGERDYAGASVELRIDPELKHRLDVLGQNAGSSLFVTLLTGFMVLLMRLTGREDVMLGTPVSGRIRIETEPLIGLFLNTLPIRAALTPDLHFREAVARVRAVVLEGLEHGEAPFDRIVQATAPERSGQSHPLFETLFNFTPTPPRTIDIAGLRARFEAPETGRCDFSTTLYVSEWAGGLDLKLAYQRVRYSAARMAILLDQYAGLLAQAAGDPELRLSDIDLVTQCSALADPSIALDAPAQVPITGQILAWAERTPDAPALSHKGVTLSYREFALAMGGVAARLCKAGMQPGDVVAVHARRCPQLMAAMAAVLHEGGVLLTLDPALPQVRRAAMLAQARTRFVLHAGSEPVGLGATLLALGEDPAEPGAGAAMCGLRDPAYIFFTSGSTGMPKAVRGTAAGLAHFLDWQRSRFGLGPGDRCAQLTGASFDVVLRDVFLPLVSGAELVVPDDDRIGTVEWLAAERITSLHAVPSVAEAWLVESPGTSLPALRLSFFAGEPLAGTLATEWRRGPAPNAVVVNLYGPTETTLAKCSYVVPDAPDPGIQPLGRPLPQAQAIVLTPARRRCGVGEVGEIAIRTPFRSLGYLDAEAETARRFVASPFGDDTLYLTGDRGVIDAEGLLHFRGRMDGQVKLRGVRIEPSEIAAALRMHADVAACAVVIHADAPTGPMLAAYVVAQPDGERSARHLRDYLRQRLPAPMVPQAFVFLDALPLTANHKLDKAKLPPVVMAGGERHIAPRDTIELQIAQIWEELLGVDRIGVADSFFDLGGHSLLAMRLLVRLEQRLGRKVPLSALFENPTIEHFANIVRRQEAVDSQIVRLWAGKGDEVLFLVHTGGGTVLNYVPLVRHLAPALPVHAVQAGGLSGEAEPLRDVPAMAADYVARLRALQPNGPYRIGGHSFGGVVAYEMARQIEAAGERVVLLALFDSALARPGESEGEDVTAEQAAARDLAGAVAIFRRFTGLDVAIDHADLGALAIDEQVARVAEAFARNGSLPAEDGVQLVRNLLLVAEAHRSARRSYRPAPSPVPITLFRASEGERRDSEETLGWQVSGAPVRVLWVAGDHVKMMAERHAAGLAERLSACLAETLGR